jgi:myo-inositol-1(or 4)-monophosphatase
MAQLAQHDLDEIYAFAVDLGKRAGKLLLDGIDKRVGGADVPGELAFTEKDNAVDIVTQTDEGPGKILYYIQHRFCLCNH